MKLTDLAIQYIKQEDPLVFQMEWFEEVTGGMCYPKMSRFRDAFDKPKHILLFFKLVQMDIYRSQPKEEHINMMLMLEYFVIMSLRDVGLSSDVWDEISGMDIIEFARQWDIKIPADGIDMTVPYDKSNVAERKIPERMPSLLTADDSHKLYTFLLDNKFISLDTSLSSFHYRMGVVGAATDDQRPIKWKKNKQLLREMLELCFCELIDSGSYLKADIEKRVPKCFIDRKDKTITLSKNKVEESSDRDLLLSYFGKS